MSDSNDSGDLSLSCLVSSIEVSVEGDLETVKLYQFERDKA